MYSTSGSSGTRRSVQAGARLLWRRIGGIGEESAFIPQPDDGLARGVVVAKEAQRAGVQIETPALERGELEPPRGHHPQHIAVPKEKDVATAAAQPVDHTIGARSNVGSGFALRAAIFEQTPCRVIRTNLGRSSSLVLAVVPLGQIGIDDRDRAEAGKFTRPPCPLKRTGEHVVEPHLAQPFTERPCLLLTARGERDIGAARVLASNRPRCLAVTNDAHRRQIR